jgi:hypothetical protein
LAWRQRRASESRVYDAGRVLELERGALTQSGGVAFRFEYHKRHDISEIQKFETWGDVNFGCFIGGAGEIYAYDSRNHTYGEQPNRVPEADYNRAIKLAKSLHYLALKTRTVGTNLGTGKWTVMVAGEVTFLKETGNSVGELSDPSAVELVKMIAAWCPYATDRPR